jgi:uncharacterized membrane protein
MTNLIAAAVAFLLLHLLVAGTRLRDTITRVIGDGTYTGLYSMASVAGLIWIGVAFGAARGGIGDTVYWASTNATRIVQLFIQFVAVLFIVPGLMTRNPASVGQGRASEDQDVVQGMLRITRHPVLWGVAIWAGGHLTVDGDVASLILFGTFLVLALSGTVSIDAKRQRVFGPTWQEFAQRTSNIPFGAIASGRQSFSVAEIGYLRLGAAVVVYLFLLGAHHHVFGAFVLQPGAGL